MSKDTLTIKKDDLWKYSTVALLIVLVVGALIVFSGPTNTGNNVAPNEQPPTVRASIDGDPVLGDEDAPVTIFEFTDYECPFCGRHHAQTYPLIKEDYIDTGKVRYVLKDFPLSNIHPTAIPAAVAAECVRDAGGSDEDYFNYADTLYNNQQSMTNSNLKDWAQAMGYDIGSCLDNMEFQSEVQGDLEEARAAGGTGTPHFVIMKSGESEGISVRGAQPYSVFQQAIESML